MYKRLLLSTFSLCLAFGSPARAETTQFVCSAEDSANAIGAAVVESQERADEMAQPLVMLGECQVLDEKMFVYIVHRGATFGTTFKVTVVGLSSKMGGFPVMWSLMPTDELPVDDTI